MNTASTIIVIPAFNEERRLLPRAFIEAVDSCDGIDFLLVDDGSVDHTKQVISDLCAQNPKRLHSLFLAQNGGKAEAIRQGFKVAFAKSYAYIGYWDADLATPLAAIPDLLGEFAASDRIAAVLGSRVKLLGRDISRSRYRHYLGRLFATLVSITLNLGVYDTQCGAKIFKNSPLLQKAFASPFISRWIFDVEILTRLKLLGLPLAATVVEYPLKAWHDIRGSKVSFDAYLRAIGELAHIFFLLRWRRPARQNP